MVGHGLRCAPAQLPKLCHLPRRSFRSDYLLAPNSDAHSSHRVSDRSFGGIAQSFCGSDQCPRTSELADGTKRR